MLISSETSCEIGAIAAIMLRNPTTILWSRQMLQAS